MTTIAQRILGLLAGGQEMTIRRIAAGIYGSESNWEIVGNECRKLEKRAILERRKVPNPRFGFSGQQHTIKVVRRI